MQMNQPFLNQSIPIQQPFLNQSMPIQQQYGMQTNQPFLNQSIPIQQQYGMQMNQPFLNQSMPTQQQYPTNQQSANQKIQGNPGSVEYVAITRIRLISYVMMTMFCLMSFLLLLESCFGVAFASNANVSVDTFRALSYSMIFIPLLILGAQIGMLIYIKGKMRIVSEYLAPK